MDRLSLVLCDLGRTPICDLYDNTEFRARNIVETLSINEITGLTFELPVVPDGKWLQVKNEMLILFNDEYYKIKTLDFNHDDDGKLYVKVTTKHYSDTLAMDLISISETTPLNVIDLMKVALCYDESGKPTLGWSVGQVTVDRVAVRGLEALEQSPFSILLTIAEKFDGILKFNSKTMTVDMLERQPTDRPVLDLRVSKNLKNFQISYDTSEMYTRLYCYGATDENGVTLDITSVNPTELGYIDNFEYFKTIGYTDEFINAHKELFISTNIWTDDNYYDAQDLYDDGVKELAKIAVPIVDVSISALDTKAMGLSNEMTQLELGSCVRIVDEDLGVNTLCNVTTRSKDYEHPHILTCQVTNSITYHDTLSKLFTDVNTASSVVTSGGSIVGGQGGGIGMDDVKDYLNTYYINAEQIEAKYAQINDLQANYVTVEYLNAHYIDAESIAAGYATIGQLHAIEAEIENLDVDYINGKLAEFEQLSADMGEFKNLVATAAEIEELKSGTITVTGMLKAANAEIDNLQATSVTTGEFEAYKATIEKLFALYATIEYLETNYLKAQQIEATYAKITSLDAVEATIENLKVTVANVETLVAKKASIEDLNAVKATIESLTADVANINKIIANVVTTEYLEAELAKINTLITDEISAVNAKITALDAKFATIEQLNVEIANVKTLIADKANIGDLDAVKADIGELEAGLANINTIISGSIGAGLIQTIHLTAQNVVIDDAVISDLIASKISVDMLKAGIISTNKFQVQSDDGGFKVVGNTTQWTDATGKVRMQAGRDAEGNFNFAVFGTDGTTSIFDENGIHEAGIPDGIIRDDMVADDANIQASKIQYISTEGNKTLQTIIDVQQGQISGLIQDTTIDGTSLKDKFTQLETTVDGLNVTVGDVQSDVGTINSQIASLNLTVDGLTTEVSQAGTDAEEAKTLAQQTSDKFSWLVKSGTSSTNFELTDRTATLVANQINLKGLVQFSGLNSDVQNKINNATKDAENLIPTYLFPTGTNITPWVTGTALSRTLGQADPYGGSDALKLTPTASNPQMKINKGGVLKQTGLHTFSVWLKASKAGQMTVFVNASTSNSDLKKQTFDVGTTWKHYTMTVDVDDLNLDFDVLIGGFSTWTDIDLELYVYRPKLVYGVDNTVLDTWVQDAVINGNTTINGGYIKTQTISTDQLAVDDIFATGSAVMNIISAQEINADRITSGTIKANYIELYGLNVLQKDTDRVTLGIDTEGNITMRGSVESYNYVSGKAGWSIKNDGDAEFNDVTVRGSVITNDGGIVSSGGSGENLLQNSGFNNGSDSWYGANSTTVSNETIDGRQALKIDSSTTVGVVYGYGMQNVDIALNSSYTFSGSIYIESSEPIDVSVAALYKNNSDENIIVSTEIFTMNHGWNDFSFTFTSNDTYSEHIVGVACKEGNAIYLYHPKLEEGTVATAWSPASADNIKQVRFWAGSSYEHRDSAPFRVYSDGSVEATEGTYSGVWTGDIRVGNISIVDPSSVAGGDAVFTIQDGQNGINAVELTDKEYSRFKQSLYIASNGGSTMISLDQGGSIVASTSVTVGSTNKVIIDDDSININGGTLTNTGGVLTVAANTIDIGNADSATPIDMNGDATVNGVLKAMRDINYNDVIVCKTSVNGLDFSFLE